MNKIVSLNGVNYSCTRATLLLYLMAELGTKSTENASASTFFSMYCFSTFSFPFKIAPALVTLIVFFFYNVFRLPTITPPHPCAS